jgi:hypothetical protein
MYGSARHLKSFAAIFQEMYGILESAHKNIGARKLEMVSKSSLGKIKINMFKLLRRQIQPIAHKRVFRAAN